MKYTFNCDFAWVFLCNCTKLHFLTVSNNQSSKQDKQTNTVEKPNVHVLASHETPASGLNKNKYIFNFIFFNYYKIIKFRLLTFSHDKFI